MQQTAWLTLPFLLISGCTSAGPVAAAPDPLTFSTVPFEKGVWNLVAPLRLSLTVPSSYVFRELKKGDGLYSGYLWGTGEDLDRVIADPEHDLSTIQRGVFRARISMNVGYDALTDTFTDESTMADTIQHQLGFTVVGFARKRLGGYPALAVTFDTPVRRGYMLYISTLISSNTLLISYHHPQARTPKDDEVWQRFLRGLEQPADQARGLGGAVGPLAQAQTDVPGAHLRDETYTSADRAYRVKIPPLLKPGAKVQERRVDPTTTLVFFTDDFGHLYYIVQTDNREAGLTLEQHAEKVDAGNPLHEKQFVETSRGRELRVARIIAGGSPLVTRTQEQSGWVERKNDLIEARSIFKHGDYLYRVGAGVTPLSIRSGTDLIPEAKKRLEEFLRDLVFRD